VNWNKIPAKDNLFLIIPTLIAEFSRVITLELRDIIKLVLIPELKLDLLCMFLWKEVMLGM